jgi:hypothetical protein
MILRQQSANVTRSLGLRPKRNDNTAGKKTENQRCERRDALARPARRCWHLSGNGFHRAGSSTYNRIETSNPCESHLAFLAQSP